VPTRHRQLRMEHLSTTPRQSFLFFQNQARDGLAASVSLFTSIVSGPVSRQGEPSSHSMKSIMEERMHTWLLVANVVLLRSIPRHTVVCRERGGNRYAQASCKKGNSKSTRLHASRSIYTSFKRRGIAILLGFASIKRHPSLPVDHGRPKSSNGKRNEIEKA
jgi:hypothetical protein